MNLKPFSTVAAEDWYKNLVPQERVKVQVQYVGYKQRYEDFKNQVVTSKNRTPSGEEWRQFTKTASLPPELSSTKEKGLVTGEITKEALSWIVPGGKLAATAAAPMIAMQLASQGKRPTLSAVQKYAKDIGESGTVGDLRSLKDIHELVNKLKNQERRLKVRLTKEEAKKLPAIFKNQAM